MNTVQATIYGAKLLIHLLLGHNPIISAKSTMNERLDILGNARPAVGEQVKLQILTVGNRGHRYKPGQDGIALTSIIDHTANHAAEYHPMPFCMRAVNDDIPLASRNKYALRKEEMHGGQNYYAYYGLRLNISPDQAPVNMKKITREDGTVIETPFIPATSDLFPEAIELPDTGAITTTDVRLAASAIINVVLSENDIEEYVNCAKIIYGGDERYAIMSEFGLCTAADRQVSVQSTAGTINFIEAIGTQIYSFAADHKALYYNSQELTLDFDIGNQVPMLATASIPTLETIGSTT